MARNRMPSPFSKTSRLASVEPVVGDPGTVDTPNPKFVTLPFFTVALSPATTVPTPPSPLLSPAIVHPPRLRVTLAPTPRPSPVQTVVVTGSTPHTSVLFAVTRSPH